MENFLSILNEKLIEYKKIILIISGTGKIHLKLNIKKKNVVYK